MWNCCKQCGALLEDDATICPHCGKAVVIPKVEPAPMPAPMPVPKPIPKPVPTPTESPSESPDEAVDPIPKHSLWIPTTKQKLIIGGILLALVLIGSWVYNAFFSAQRAVSKYEAVVNGDVEQLRSLAPDEYWEFYASANRTSIDAYVSKKADKLESDYAAAQLNGSLISAKITIQDTDKLSYGQQNSLSRYLAEEYGIDSDRLNEAVELNLRVYVNSKSRDTETTCTVIAVQIDLQWYLMRSSKSTYSTEYYFIAAGTLAALKTY